MGKKLDLTGMRFGRLTVLEECGRSNSGHVQWKCICDCGNTTIAIGKDIKRGHTQSCGCLGLEGQKPEDITGQRFGRLTVLGYVPRPKKRGAWECQCDCGNITIVPTDRLKSGNTKSCGCLHREMMIEMFTTHGMAGSRIYRIWYGIKDRCFNSNSEYFRYYGGRGISVCERWRNSFENFLADMIEGYREDLSIDRIDVNGDYEPSNCRWATLIEQANNKRNSALLEYDGEVHTHTEWERMKGLTKGTIRRRIMAGWDMDRLFLPPTR